MCRIYENSSNRPTHVGNDGDTNLSKSVATIAPRTWGMMVTCKAFLNISDNRPTHVGNDGKELPK